MAETAMRHQMNRPVSVAEYLERERESPVKHEYVHGELYAFAGATERHNLIAGNVFGLLWAQARGDACRVFMSDMQLQATPHAFYYPDVMVVCDATDNDPLVKRRPCAIVEVLSPSTTRIDRHEKLLAYREIDSLRAYIIVDAEVRRVTRHWRDDHDAWQQQEIINGDIAFPCPETTLSLDEVYEGVS